MLFPLLLALTTAAAGFAVVSLKTARIAHPILQRNAWNIQITGFVEMREERERTDRITLRVHSIEGQARRSARARAALGAQEYRAAGRRLHRGEGAAQSAAAAVAAGRL